MNGRKEAAQSSVELVILFAFSLVVLIFLFGYLTSSNISIDRERSVNYAKNSTLDLANAVNSVYSEGDGAKRLVFVKIPDGAESSYINGRIIGIKVFGNDVWQEASASISGTMPQEPGGYWLLVQAKEGYVAIGETFLEISKSSIYVQMEKSDSKYDFLIITNNYSASMDINIAKDWTNTELSLNVSPVLFTLAAGESRTIDLNFSSSATAAGVYSGSLAITGSYASTQESILVPITAEVLTQGTVEKNLSVMPTSWPATVQQDATEVKSFTICNNSDSDMTTVSFTPSGDAGAWVGQPIAPIAPLIAYSCQAKDLNLHVPPGQAVGTYTGTITVSDGTNSDAITTSITVTTSVDTTPPIIMLEAPAPAYVDPDGVLQFDCNVNDLESSINSCSLLINSSVDQTDNTITEGITQSFTKSGLTNGSYIWDVNCTNSASLQGSSSQNRAFTVAISTQQTTTRWALYLCNWGSCDSTANVTGTADNVYDSTTANSLGGYGFDVSGLSGTIDSVKVLWSHEVPAAPITQSSIVETTVADFSDGTFTNTAATNNSGGEVALAAATKLTNVLTTTTRNAFLYIGRSSSQQYGGQSFIPLVNSITGVSVNVMRTGTPANPLVVRLRSSLTGADIATASIPVSSVTTSYQWIDAMFASPVSITSGATYYIVLTTAANSKGNYFRWGTNNTNPYANGNSYQNTTAQATTDALLRTYYNGYQSSGNYVSSSLDFGSVKTIADLKFSTTLNGQTLTVAYQTSSDCSAWGAWSSEYAGSPITINASARCIKYRATFSGGSLSTAYLNDVNVTAQSGGGALVDDSVALNYGLTNYNDLNPSTYNSGNTPVDRMDTNYLLAEIYDATAQRPGGGSWSWGDFSSLKIGGKYNAVSSADSSWQLDAVGVEIKYTS